MADLTLSNNAPTMTSRQIAELVESRHDSVRRTIERLAESGAIQLPPLVEVKNGQGQSVQEYAIGKRDSYVIVAQLSPAFTARLVDRWQELEEAAPKAIDLNNPHALRAALLGYSERVIALESKIEVDAPKVKFAEIIRAMDGVCLIGKFAKAAGMGRNKLFKRLKEDKILMRDRMPYQKYIDRGYFTVIEQTPYKNSDGETIVPFTTMLTGAGQVFLAKRYADLMEAA